MSRGVSDGSAAEVQAQIHYRLLEETAAAERRYRILIEHLREPVFQLDGDRRLSFVNAAWCSALGSERSHSIGRDLLTFVDPRDADRVRAAFKRLDGSADGDRVTVEFRVVRSCGTPLDVECSLQRSLDSDVIGSLHDLSKHKVLEDRLRAARDAAESASRLKSSFLANMSHEIRTPLSAVLGFAEVLGEGSVSAEERKDYAGRVERNGKHLLGLIDDILDFSKIESGRLEVCAEPFELCEVVDDVVAVFSGPARAKGLEVSTSWSGGGWKGGDFVSDALRLRQILSNLLSNAVKFTTAGSIRLEVQVDGDAQTVAFVVHDTGIGIPQDRLDSVFEPFRQADQHVTRRFGGTGLGLAISGRLAALLGGRLSAVSTPGQGSRFRLELPLRSTEPKLGAPGTDPSGRTQSRPRGAVSRRFEDLDVLVVEDTDDLRGLMVRFLEDIGVRVETAANGAEAFAKIHPFEGVGTRYDLVLMDIQMPVMDGYAATQALRARGFDGLIVALTAYAMTGDRDKCLEAGCDDYLPKPVNRRALRELLDRHFSVGAAPCP